ncbi:MAG: DUF1428 domain-containing protein [Bacteriovoracia bacterium]
MSRYVEGFVIPIPRKNLKAYQKMAEWGRKAWMKHGAINYYECVMSDFVKHGQGFRKMCKLKPSETAIFAFITYKSKAHSRKVFRGVKIEMEKYGAPKDMPFDMKRFAMAGCKVIVHAAKGR